ncbi:MAG: hypothetical protein CVU00_15545 [Bacteroidetes bacterium HGW-Bacteroidetes-17]|jgi:hypothetical protein|nr:MAG: hypothetical protein CVU00_15545 [Bacteroidetes bacterium HGW-Bacteroidetes-17]
MKFLNTLQDKDGKNFDVDGHQHTKSEITDMPTKLSDFNNDIGVGRGTVFTTSATAPTDPSPGDYWNKIL